MKIRARAVVCNHKGNVRGNNEDAFFLNGFYLPLERMDEGGTYTADASTPCQVYAVCDGMGGEVAGEMASFTMTAALSSLMESIDRCIEQNLPAKTILDLGGLTFMDSSGIAVLIRCKRRMDELGGTLRAVSIPTQPRRVLDAAGVGRLISLE